jgi:hypothetical protein
VHELERAFEVAAAKALDGRRLPISAANFLDPGWKSENARRLVCSVRHSPSKDTTNDEWTPSPIVDDPFFELRKEGETQCASDQSRSWPRPH